MARHVMTVQGPADPNDLGIVLPHEHIMSTFGAPATDTPSYDQDRLLALAVPYLRRIAGLGCGAVVDCTTEYFGREPGLLRRISQESGVHIVTNTGYYAAAADRYVPDHALREDAPTLAARWTAEWRDGIRDTGIRPGFIKIAVDEGPLSELDRKVVRAAGLAHRETGLLIQNHLGNNPTVAREILEVLAQDGVPPASWVWVHAHTVPDASSLRAAMEQGALVSLDGLGESSAGHILDLLRAIREWGRLGQVLLSHDGNAYDTSGGSRPFHYLMTHFIPLLESAGFRPEEIRTLTSVNPARALSVES
jgi:phosphotriesterase-related protein